MKTIYDYNIGNEYYCFYFNKYFNNQNSIKMFNIVFFKLLNIKIKKNIRNVSVKYFL